MSEEVLTKEELKDIEKVQAHRELALVAAKWWREREEEALAKLSKGDTSRIFFQLRTQGARVFTNSKRDRLLTIERAKYQEELFAIGYDAYDAVAETARYLFSSPDSPTP